MFGIAFQDICLFADLSTVFIIVCYYLTLLSAFWNWDYFQKNGVNFVLTGSYLTLM